MTNSKNAPFCIRLRSELPGDEWDDFVSQLSDEAWLWHLNDFQQVMIDRGLYDLSFGVKSSPEGELLAVVPLHLRHRKELGLFAWVTAHSHGAPALRNGISKKQRAKIMAAIRTHLEEVAEERKIIEITFSIPPAAPAYRGNQCPAVNPLVMYDYECTPDQIWMLDLSPEMGTIRELYSYQTRSDLRKARDFTIQDVKDKTDLPIYYRLHLETCQRTGDQPHPWKYYETIFDRFLPTGRCRILFYIKDGQAVAAQCTGLFKGGANYWFGASLTDKPQHGGENRKLFDLQFEKARQAGMEWYFLGNAFSKGKLAGISEFKGSFGSQLFPYFRGRAVFRPKLRTFFSHLELITGYSE